MHTNVVTTDKLVQALNNGEFVPYIQPIVRTTDMTISGGELLVRWLTPIGEIIPPDNFIKQAESSGLLSLITQKILIQAVHGLTDMNVRLPSVFRLAVNVTPALLVDDDFTQMCKSLADMYNIHLILELTEQQSFFMNSQTKIVVSRLREAGVEFALDDFGIGNSVLSYLKYFPISYIKMDKSFIQDVSYDEVSRHIVESMSGLADKLGINTVAEGVETQEQVNCLRALGVNYLQGYYFGSPVELNMFINKYLSMF